MNAAELDYDSLRSLVQSGPTPLFATVSGAHLYGFPSPDSDVDLRGVFVQRLYERLRLERFDETISIMRDVNGVELDWVAHDIRKFASLMLKRNGYVLEQLFSPLVVLSGSWHEEMMEIGRGCVVRHLYHHYQGFAQNQRKALDVAAPTLKDLLYAYRVYLTGIHVLRSGALESNPSKLIQLYPHDGVNELIARKTTETEYGALRADENAKHQEALDALESKLLLAFEQSSLPDAPTTFDALSDFVARVCTELGRG